MPSPVEAWSHPCAYVNDNYYGGIQEFNASGMSGVREKLEDTSSTTGVLCGVGGTTPALSASLIELNRYGWNKLVLGTGVCSGDGCYPGGYFDSGYFTEYGRTSGGVCDNAVVPSKYFVATTWSPGTWWFQVYKSSSWYDFRVSGSVVWSYPVSTADGCWGGPPVIANYLNTHWDTFDQWPGRVSETQSVSSATWTDGSGTAHSVSRPYGSACDIVGPNGDRCVVSSAAHDAWFQWDSRQP